MSGEKHIDARVRTEQWERERLRREQAEREVSHRSLNNARSDAARLVASIAGIAFVGAEVLREIARLQRDLDGIGRVEDLPGARRNADIAADLYRQLAKKIAPVQKQKELLTAVEDVVAEVGRINNVDVFVEHKAAIAAEAERLSAKIRGLRDSTQLASVENEIGVLRDKKRQLVDYAAAYDGAFQLLESLLRKGELGEVFSRKKHDELSELAARQPDAIGTFIDAFIAEFPAIKRAEFASLLKQASENNKHVAALIKSVKEFETRLGKSQAAGHYRDAGNQLMKKAWSVIALAERGERDAAQRQFDSMTSDYAAIEMQYVEVLVEQSLKADERRSSVARLSEHVKEVEEAARNVKQKLDADQEARLQRWLTQLREGLKDLEEGQADFDESWARVEALLEKTDRYVSALGEVRGFYELLRYARELGMLEFTEETKNLLDADAYSNRRFVVLSRGRRVGYNLVFNENTGVMALKVDEASADDDESCQLTESLDAVNEIKQFVENTQLKTDNGAEVRRNAKLREAAIKLVNDYDEINPEATLQQTRAKR